MKPIKRWMISLVVCVCSTFGMAAVRMENVEYQSSVGTFQGLLVYPADAETNLPGVLMIHNWLGVSEETRTQATRMAELGYVVFAADIYGKGVRPTTAEEAIKLVGTYRADRKRFRERLQLGLETFRAQPGVDKNRIVAVGYCFGGTGVIELARSGADIQGVVSFHGGLDSPTPEDGRNIKASVLALHGADDPQVKAEDLAAFEEEMRVHKVDWQLVKYGNAVHSFTEKSAGNDNATGVAYNAKADARSFEDFKDFAQEVLAGGQSSESPDQKP
ncbi:MAG: dienelactone hydrolase family protein [Pseudobdellovibrionaceae bacterium]|nr:dienelactone hydrolase family protein [Pseudobdellovibrionaceae bacterium]